MIARFTNATRLVALLAALSLLGVAGLRLAAAQETTSDQVETLAFDVAEDATRFVFDPDVVHEDGMPAAGSAFITHGYVYPAGTLDEGTGVLPDGSPESPDEVLGEWVCRGWLVGDGMHTTSGPAVITTQVYSLGEEPGEALLITDGYELADVGVEVARAITGGTGPYAGAVGEQLQTLLGFNATMGVNLTVEIEVAER